MKSIKDYPMPDIAEADEYLLARWGNESPWAKGTEEQKNQALQRGWDYLAGLNWKDGLFDVELPEAIHDAGIVAAFEEIKNPGCLLPEQAPGDFLQSKKIGPISKTFRRNAPTRRKFLALERLVAPYIMKKQIRICRG